jgi:2'-5' RNA ligase
MQGMTVPSLFFMAKPQSRVRQAMLQVLANAGWDRQLGDTLFAPDNWHQSLSHPVASTPALRQGMLEAGPHIQATAFTMALRHVRAKAGLDNAIHWAFTGQGAPRPFAALVEAVRLSLRRLALDGMPGHSRHVTVSYRAPGPLASTEIVPIPWRIDEVLLVESAGSGAGFHYRQLGRWPLRAAPPGPESQRALW